MKKQILVMLILVAVFTSLIVSLYLYSTMGQDTHTEYDPERRQSIVSHLVASSPNNQREPAIYGQVVVWSENIQGYWQIMMQNLNEDYAQQITFGPLDHIYPSISGDKIIWWEGSSGDSSNVGGFSLSTNTQFNPTSNTVSRPKTGNSGVVWVANDSSSTLVERVMYFNYAHQTIQVIINTKGPNWPTISANIVIWRDMRNGNSDIYGYNIDNNTEIAISQSPDDQERPDIYENTVVCAFRPNRTP